MLAGPEKGHPWRSRESDPGTFETEAAVRPVPGASVLGYFESGILDYGVAV